LLSGVGTLGGETPVGITRRARYSRAFRGALQGHCHHPGCKGTCFVTPRWRSLQPGSLGWLRGRTDSGEGLGCTVTRTKVGQGSPRGRSPQLSQTWVLGLRHCRK
jgi:hypothetical protein